MKVTFVGDTSDRSNWGCRATTSALRALIEQHGSIVHTLDIRRLSSPLPSVVEPTDVIDSASVPTSRLYNVARRLAHVGQPVIERIPFMPPSVRLRHQLSARSLDDLADEVVRGSIVPYFADAVRSSDIVVINGEGSMIENRLVGRLKILLAYVAKQRLGTPCVIVNHSADLGHPSLRKMIERVYPLLDDVVVRERRSLEAVRVVRPDVRFGADAVFSTAIDEGARGRIVADLGERYICIGGTSSYLNSDARTTRRLSDDYRRLSTELLQHGRVVVTASSGPDDLVLEPVATELGLPYFGPRTPISDGLALMASAAVYVGGRWHPSIMAMLGGTPLVGFGANTAHKSDGILALARLPHAPFDPFAIGENSERIGRLCGEMIHAGDDLRSSIRQVAVELAESSQQNVLALR